MLEMPFCPRIIWLALHYSQVHFIPEMNTGTVPFHFLSQLLEMVDITKAYKTFVLLQLLSATKEKLSAGFQILYCSYSTLSYHYALGFLCFQTVAYQLVANILGPAPGCSSPRTG